MDKITDFLEQLCIFLICSMIEAIVYGGILMMIWNYLMPIVFGLPTINFLQAFLISFSIFFLL